MGWISWIVLGALAGWIARRIMGIEAHKGIVSHILTGIVGACLGGWIAARLGLGAVTGINLGSVLVATGGACLFLFIKDKVFGRRG